MGTKLQTLSTEAGGLRFARYLVAILFVLSSAILWFGSIAVFRILNATQLRYLFPAIQLAIIFGVFWLSARYRKFVAIGLTALGTALLAFYSVELIAVGLAFLALNAWFVFLDNISRRSPKAFALRVLLVCVSTTLALSAAEILSRALYSTELAPNGPAPDKDEYQVSYAKVGQRIHWAGETFSANRANAVMRVLSKQYDHKITFNGKGLRGPELSYEKQNDTYRILILGDSFIEAVQIKDPDLIEARLADLIKPRGLLFKKKVEVLGAGVTGWGTVDEYLYYRDEGVRYDPDLVIVVFIPNDPGNNLPRGALTVSDQRTNRRVVIKDNEIEVVAAKETLAELLRLSMQRVLDRFPAVVRESSVLWSVIYRAVARPAVLQAVQAQGATSLESQLIDRAWKNTEGALKLLLKQVDESGARLALVSVPSHSAVNRTDASQAIIDSRLADVCGRLAIPWLNLLPEYQAAVRSGISVQPGIYGEIDKHWTASGARLSADILAQWLASEKIIF